ncbi:hypothetical protein GCM10010211_41400 [Streptomyces albospinus]|uniref:Uncharacterized protein n=1 Tax=Streptomyces albospinus TaxID=285515 RepID=A0ABQ2V794_9ACTN|nr:hypothetical protein [Streptomyces albospinus]GGU71491.1 hypothetical protein GCM10010211_41400 [Streptomyces albospinus]
MTRGPGTPGIWCERVVYGSLDADVVVSWVTLAVDSPAQAARASGADARRMAGGLSGRARRRVLSGVDGGGRVGAVAALHRGEPCGLALECGGVWAEWSARPVVFLSVEGRAGARCPVLAGEAVGFV